MAVPRRFRLVLLFAFVTIASLPGLTATRPALAVAGDLDSSFGSGGKVITGPKASPNLLPAALLLQPDGKIVVAGTTGLYGDVIVIRYNSNGSLDPTFGSSGMVTVHLIGRPEWG